MPYLDRIDMVPMAAFTLLQQIVNAGAGGAARVVSNPSLAEVATLGVRGEVQVLDDVRRA